MKNKIKKWIINKFFNDVLEDVYQLASIDAFSKAHADVMETLVETDKEKIQEEAIKIVDNLLSNVDLTKVVLYDKRINKLLIGGKEVDDITMYNLISEAEFLENSEIWKLIHETPKELASRAMFVSGETVADMQKGKSILYVLSVQKNIIETIKGIKR